MLGWLVEVLEHLGILGRSECQQPAVVSFSIEAFGFLPGMEINMDLKATQSLSLKATVKDGRKNPIAGAAVVFASSDPAVLDVQPGVEIGTAVVKTVGLGVASVTAKAGNATSAPLEITVVPGDPAVIELTPGEPQDLAA